jgi:hypothetical protein
MLRPFPLKRLDFVLQGTFVDVTTDPLIDFHDRGQGTLTEASNRSQREFLIWSREQDFIGFAGLAGIIQAKPQFEPRTFSRLREPRVWRGVRCAGQSPCR